MTPASAYWGAFDLLVWQHAAGLSPGRGALLALAHAMRFYRAR